MTQDFVLRFAAASVLAFVALGCVQKTTPPMMPDREVRTDVFVKVTGESGAYQFVYSGDYSDGKGNLDFTALELEKKTVRVDFIIDQAGSIPGIKFQPTNKGAIWIALTSEVGENNSPVEKYKGDQFTGFATEAGGKRAHFISKNTDRKSYRYSTRFDLDGELIPHDPDLKNGGIGQMRQ